jgi:type I restriction enzyme S subunit
VGQICRFGKAIRAGTHQYAERTERFFNRIELFELMGKWINKKIKELCHIGRGRVISQEEIQNNPGIYPVYSSQSVNKGEMGRIDTYDFEGEYVTWTTDGAYAGTVFYREGKFNCTNVCGTLKAKNERELDLLFLSYLLSINAKKYVSYVGNPKLMNGVMAEIELSLPQDKSEQTRIAQILSTADRAIAQTEALIAKYQRIKTGLMQDLLTKGIDQHGRIRSEQTHRFKTEKGLRVPEEWEVVEMDTFCKLITKGESPNWQGFKYQSEGPLFITSENVREGNLDLVNNRKHIPLAFHQKLSRSQLFYGDILINLVGASIARSAIYDEYEEANINQAVSLIRVNTDLVSTIWLAKYLQFDSNIHRLLGEQVETARANLSLTDLRKYLVAKPKKVEQEIIAIRLNLIDETINKEIKYLNKLQTLKTGLMQDLLSGRVRVKVSESEFAQ